MAINNASNAAAAHETVDLCAAAATGPDQGFVPIKGDIGNRDDRAGLLAHTLDMFGRLDAGFKILFMTSISAIRRRSTAASTASRRPVSP